MQIIPDLLPTLALSVPFLVTLVAIHFILFKPLLDYLDERNEVSHRARHEAEHLDKKAQAHLTQVEVRLAEARSRAAVIRAEARAKALKEEARIVSAARAAAEARVAQGVATIQGEAQLASAQLRGEANQLAAQLVEQVLGRPAKEA